MVQTISASRIANVIPGVVAAGGSNLLLNGLMLTESTRAPIGAVEAFSSPDTVGAYFGLESDEYIAAQVYFKGFDNASKLPAQMLFAQYPTAAVAGYLRGGTGLTLADVQAITAGALDVTVDGTVKSATGINLSAATSFSNAASIIEAAFTSPGFTVTYDSLSAAFVITSSSTGASSTIAVATGATATSLKLTAATGAVTSPGADAAVPATFMDGVVAITRNWFCFSHVFEPSTDDAIAFAAWNDAQGDSFAYSAWASVLADTQTIKTAIDAANDNGVTVTYAPINTYKTGAAFVMGYYASLNYPSANGRTTLDKRSQSGLVADVSDNTTYDTLRAAGINTYGIFGTAANTFTFYSNGAIGGAFLWADSYANQRLLNDAIQVAEIVLMQSVGQIPYNNDGYELIRQSIVGGPVNDGLTFGSIRAGVNLSADQIAAINSAAGGIDAATSVINEGFYLLITDPGASARTARTTPNIKLWYADGQAVQQLTVSSFEVQ